ncbi:UvrD-helicase domain-containing protein [Corynebacterium caspium]|uniref:UvrD-helicase domain-containing protein n=1 Tax=Corynebacterium caspium TaxID=234828 RepID=UPI00036290E1|nr:UvrD-helicase domain-containing protein [Corynebacterium caspium]WKD59690.1 ATP-dependent DNA helicase PcrA [Corynebacterium caspium DSM 44850]
MSTNDSFNPVISPNLLAAVLNRNSPTPQQAEVTGAPPGPMLVVAGAGAGKTETMAARAVWLVANGLATPEQILGLTFTRKAAQQLKARIRDRLALLAGTPKVRDLDPSGKLADILVNSQPTVLTYDAYAGKLVSEYGLLVPVEPGSRIISETELFDIARTVVRNYTGVIDSTKKLDGLVDGVLGLHNEMHNHQVSPEEVLAESQAFIDLLNNLEKGPKQRSKDGMTAVLQKWMDVQQERIQVIPLVIELRAELNRRGVITFGDQMAIAAKMVAKHSRIGASQRRRFKVIMLDEYQDTSHSQRVLLRELFGNGADPSITVNAVGDPMQSIYGWRGATASNLEAFRKDFPAADGTPAPKKELTTSFRNPAQVLRLANAVSSTVLGAPNQPNRAVAPLESFGEAAGEVLLNWYATQQEERISIADLLAQRYQAAKAANKPFSAAVLVRKNSHSQPIAAELAARGVPAEIVGLSGLLTIPEVADSLAYAKMLIRPHDNQAALRILTGPHIGLGAADIIALRKRARNLAGRMHGQEDMDLADDVEKSPLDIFEAELEKIIPAEAEQIVGLADALADLGEATAFSADGLARLKGLASQLRYLRTYSLHKPLPELFNDIHTITGLKTEVLARQDPHDDGAIGTVHLDKLIAEVAAYAAIPGANLGGLLDYFELAKSKDRGLSPGEISVRTDRVQILTVHKAKGLEWSTVVVAHADKDTWNSNTVTFLSNAGLLPATLRGDANVEDIQAQSIAGAPVLEADVADRGELQKAGEAYIAEVKESEKGEATRLFYVAITRAEQELIVTGSTFAENKKSGVPPYENFDLLRQIAPEYVAHWDVELQDPGAGEVAPVAEAVFPREPQQWAGSAQRSAEIEKGAAAVFAALEELPECETDELSTLWEADVNALLQEYAALENPIVEVEFSGQATATDLVNLKENPEYFARRLRRPVPFKPNSYAKRGTAFHQWLEDRFEGQSFLDDEDLPGLGEQVPTAAELKVLKEKFLKSAWAQRTPRFVELPFEVTIGSTVVRGRMDAVFYDEERQIWEIVDWKTGQAPKGPERRAAEIQLAVYRVAFQELLLRWHQAGTITTAAAESEVVSAFHYVSWEQTLVPQELPDAAALEALLATVLIDK